MYNTFFLTPISSELYNFGPVKSVHTYLINTHLVPGGDDNAGEMRRTCGQRFTAVYAHAAVAMRVEITQYDIIPSSYCFRGKIYRTSRGRGGAREQKERGEKMLTLF